jgi:hypothetical protein
VLVSATPVLRSQMFFMPTAGRYPMSLERGTRVLIGLQVIAALARTAGMQEIRYQTVTHLFREFAQLLELLSLLDSQVRLAHDAVLPWSLGQSERLDRTYLSLVRALILALRPTRHQSLADVLRERLDHGDGDRIAVLRAIARTLSGRVHPVDAPVSAASWRVAAKARLQQWAFVRCDPAILHHAAVRISARATARHEDA